MPKDLRSFIEANEDLILRVPKTVKRDHLSTLIVQANSPVVFDNIEGYPGWRVADLFFSAFKTMNTNTQQPFKI